MKFAVGQTITLGGVRYRIRDFLGSGAVAEVYCIAPEGFPDAEVVLKLVREDMPDPLRIEGLRREAEVLAVLNQAEDPQWPSRAGFAARLQRARDTVLQRKIVALLDSGEMAPQQPFVIQEKAPPLFERFPVDTLAAERRMLRVAHAIASVMALAHRCGLALKDFEPPTKEDRIRLRWLDEEQFELKIIDWDITGGPEDTAQDLFFFGRHLYAMMTGFQLKLDQSGQPPAVLGSGLAAWERLTDGTRRILQRLLHRDPKRRYARAEDVEADLRWWVSVLEQVEQPNALNQFQDRLWRARIEERHDRALALADLALRLNPPPAVRQTLESAAQQAREELEKEIWFPIAYARGTLLTGAYARAAEEFEQQLRALPPESEAARLARLYQQLARAGSLLKSAYAGADVRSTPEWESLNRAVAELIQRRWSEAQIELRKVVQIRPEAEEWLPVKGLMHVARAGLLLQEASELVARAEPRRADADRPDWMDTEKEHIRQLEIAVSKLEEARQLAPHEPEFGERLRVEQARLRLRQEMLIRYEDAQKFIRQAEQAEQEGQEAESAGDLAGAADQYDRASQAFDNAIKELQTILKADSSQYRAQLLLARVQSRYQEAKRKHEETNRQAETVRRAEEERRQAEALIRQGAYSEALAPARRAAALLPDLEEIRNTLHWAEAGARLERLARGYLDAARQLFVLRNLEEAEKQVGTLRSWLGFPLQRLPGGENLPALIASQPFQLQAELRDTVIQLEGLIRDVRKQRGQIEEARSRGDHLVTKSALEALEAELRKHGYELAEDERKWLEEANTRIQILDEIEESLTGRPSLTDLQGMLKRLQEDRSERANRLREEIGRTWLRLLESEVLDVKDFRQSVKDSYRLANLSVAAVMEELRKWMEEAQPVQTLLGLEPGTRYPYWFEKTDTLNSNLSRLEGYLENLMREERWPLTRQQAGIWRRLSGWVEDWRKRSIGLLSDYLKEKLENARLMAQAGQYREALAEIQGVWSALPGPFRIALPPDVGQRVIEPFIASLGDRLQAEEELGRIVAQLIDNRISFTEAAERAQDLRLPDHPDVPTGDLRARVDDLEAAAEVEKSLQEEPADPDYAQAIYELHQQLGRDLSSLRQTEGLGGRLERLEKTAQETIARWAGTLRQKLEEEATNLPQRAQPDFSTFLSLYWQVRWLEQFASQNQIRASLTVPGLQEALNSAWETPRSLLNRLAEEILRVQDHFELEYIAPRLEGLRALNQGLVRLPEGLNLPPLPEGARYAPLGPLVSPADLDGLIGEVKYLLSLSGGNNRFPPAEEAGPEPNGRERFQQVVRRILEAQEHLNLLHHYWKNLGLMEWEETSSLAQLQEEIRLQKDLADTIIEALDQDPITALSRLDRGAQQRTWPEELERFPLDILAPLRRLLLEALVAFREEWIQKLGEQIAGILNNPPAMATEELQKVLREPRSREVAVALHRAISDTVDKKAQEALQAKQRDRARMLWKVVMDATWPWAPPPQEGRRPPASAQPPDASRQRLRVEKPRRRAESGAPQ